jgi:2-phosphosulfolactate phosphatase
MKKIETCFTPALYSLYHNEFSNVVVIDIMRATTSICAAFAAGAKKIIPVGSIIDAKKMKDDGYILAAERDGIVLDFADFGNSPNLFTPEKVKGKTVAYSTTNGTQAIKMASCSRNLIIGAFVNLSKVVEFLNNDEADVLLFCSGWKNKFNIEDTLCAGAIADKLISSGKFSTNCDSTFVAIDLWHLASIDIMKYIEKASHRKRLKGIVTDDVVTYCHSLDLVSVLPVYKTDSIINILN